MLYVEVGYVSIQVRAEVPFHTSSMCCDILCANSHFPIMSDHYLCDQRSYVSILTNSTARQKATGALQRRLDMAKIKNPELVFAVVPRVAAACSLFGSSFIVAEVLRDAQKRKKVYHRIMLGMSVFDIIGSICYFLGR